MLLSPGQRRLREVARSHAAALPADDDWSQHLVDVAVREMAAAVASDASITGDLVLSQPLAGTIPETYVRFQQAMYPGHDVDRIRIDVTAFSGYDTYDDELRAAPLWTGGRKPTAFHWALLWLAAGRPLSSWEAGPTLLHGSRTLLVGAGTNHRTLAALAWGDAELEVRADLVDDVLDGELLAACAVLERAIPPDLRNDSLLDWPVTFEHRGRLIETAARVSARAAPGLGDPPRSRWPGTRARWDLPALEAALSRPGPTRRWWRWRR